MGEGNAMFFQRWKMQILDRVFFVMEKENEKAKEANSSRTLAL